MNVQERRDCANCGAGLADDARFCQRCGAPVVAAPQLDGDERVDGAAPPPPDPPLPAVYWGIRAGIAVLVAVTAAAVLFAIAVLIFGAFVE